MFDKESYSQKKDQFIEEPALKHKEHIIQNALRGKLKSDNILCKKCGDKLSKEIDSDFTELFAIITEQLRDRLVQKDHGQGNSAKTLKGYLYHDEKFESKLNINFKDYQASPEIPFYKLNEENKTIKIYANCSRAKQFQPLVLRELEGQGYNLSLYRIEHITDISSEGILGLFFSEGVNNFNRKFFLGINKIATGFASHYGVKRTDLVRTLKFEDDKAEIIYSQNIFPFFPLGSFDTLLEINKAELDPYYPAHTLILFTQRYTGNRKGLYCYVELFSTFQYYVILNDDYVGEDIYEPYHQTTLKQEIPDIDIRGTRPKFLSILAEELGIERSRYAGKGIDDIYSLLEEEYKKLKVSYEINLKDTLEGISDRLMRSFMLSQYDQIPNLLDTKIIDSFKQIGNIHIPSFLLEIRPYLDKDISTFRRLFYEDDGSGEAEVLSTPDETLTEFKKSDLPAKAYGHLKFEQLSQYIHELD